MKPSITLVALFLGVTGITEGIINVPLDTGLAGSITGSRPGGSLLKSGLGSLVSFFFLCTLSCLFLSSPLLPTR